MAPRPVRLPRERDRGGVRGARRTTPRIELLVGLADSRHGRPSDLAEADGAQESAGGGGGGERRLEGEASTLSVGSGRPDVQARLAQRKNSTES